MSDYQGYRDYRDNRPRQPEPPPETDHHCRAQGCPLLGTISLGSDYCCRYHYQSTMDDWPRITDNIRRNNSLVSHVLHMEARQFNAYYREHPKAAKVREHDYSFKLSPKRPKETHEEYVIRLRDEAKKAVLSVK